VRKPRGGVFYELRCFPRNKLMMVIMIQLAACFRAVFQCISFVIIMVRRLSLLFFVGRQSEYQFTISRKRRFVSIQRNSGNKRSERKKCTQKTQLTHEPKRKDRNGRCVSYVTSVTSFALRHLRLCREYDALTAEPLILCKR